MKKYESNPRYADTEGALLGQFRLSTPTSTATGVSPLSRKYISQDIATKYV